MACPRLRALLVVTTLAACPGDNNETEGSSGSPPLTSTEVTTGPALSSSSSGEESSTGPTPTTGEPDTTSTGEVSTSSSTSLDPTTGETGSSDDTGPICDVGTLNCTCDAGACSDGSLCVANVCVGGLECPADVEPPGESEAMPVDLGDITDNNDDFFERTGVLSGATDADWYQFHGKDTLGYVAEPTYTLLSGSHRACLFVVCDNGGAAQTSIECPEGTDFAISPTLRPGCCGANSFVLGDFGCPGNDESVEMWLRLDKPAEDVCSDYSVKLNF